VSADGAPSPRDGDGEGVEEASPMSGPLTTCWLATIPDSTGSPAGMTDGAQSIAPRMPSSAQAC